MSTLLDLVAHGLTVLFLACRRASRAILRRYYRTQFAACGENVAFDPLSSEIAYGHVRVGSNVHIGPGAVMGHAQIGDDVMLGPNVHLRDGNHRYDLVGRPAIDSGSTDPGMVVVGSDVWIGDGTTVLRHGSVADGCIIGTRSLVTRPIPPYVVAAGVPCRVLKLRFSDEQLREHCRLRGRSPDEAERLIAERACAIAADWGFSKGDHAANATTPANDRGRPDFTRQPDVF